MLRNGLRSMQGIGGFAVVVAAFACTACDEDDYTTSEAASSDARIQGGLFLPETSAKAGSEAGVGANVPVTDDPTTATEPVVPEDALVPEGGGVLENQSASFDPEVSKTALNSDAAGSDEVANTAKAAPAAGTTAKTDDKWPTVDGSTKGTPAAGGPSGGGHTANHGDPSKGNARSKYVPEGSSLVSFEELASFWYEAPEPEEVVENPDFKPEDQFPEFLKKMDGDTVTVEGYVVPISIEKGRVKAFILSRYVANCCFGLMPELNEWVEVEMPEGKGLDFLPYGTVMTTGKLHVGEVFDEYGYVRCLYRIEADTVVEPDY